jgi:hypothetical protein
MNMITGVLDVASNGAGGGMMHGDRMMGGGMMGGSMEEMSTIHRLLSEHDKIQRTVRDIPNGIETTTTSSDPKLAELIRDHVRHMKARIEKGEPIRQMDPLFREIFANHEHIQISVEKAGRRARHRDRGRAPRRCSRAPARSARRLRVHRRGDAARNATDTAAPGLRGVDERAAHRGSRTQMQLLLELDLNDLLSDTAMAGSSRTSADNVVSRRPSAHPGPSITLPLPSPGRTRHEDALASSQRSPATPGGGVLVQVLTNAVGPIAGR